MTRKSRLVSNVPVIIAIALLSVPTRATEPQVPVMVGGEADLDACGAVGTVSGLKPTGGNSLSVRSGPGREQNRIDGLAPGTRVWLCDRQGAWLGVVYGPPGRECGVSTPSAIRRPYEGPCSSGWVHERYVELLAG
jgi:hypothetical protein